MIHSTPRSSRSPSYSRHMESEALSSNAQRRNQPGSYNPVQDRIRQEDERAAQLAAQQTAHQDFPDYPTTSVEVGVATRTGGVGVKTGGSRVGGPEPCVKVGW